LGEGLGEGETTVASGAPAAVGMTVTDDVEFRVGLAG
jgi:hypothetical protein